MKYEKEFQAIATLEGNQSIFFNVPISIIENTEIHSIRLSVFAYLSVYRGLNNRLIFSIPYFLEWAGYKSDAHTGGINDKVIDTLDKLNDLGFITYCGNKILNRSSYIEIEFNRNLVYELCWQESFAVFYWDEVQKIMKYKNENRYDKYLNRNTVLLVFAYLRQAIFRLPNKLKPEEQSPEGILARRKRCIEAFNGNYKDIAAAVGLSERTVSHAVKVLEQLKLIVVAEPYRIKNEIGEFRTPDTIFANAYKRERNELLATGDDYAWGEIKRKEKSIRAVIPSYHLRNDILH